MSFTDAPLSPVGFVPACLSHLAALMPARLAVADGQERISFADLEQRALDLAIQIGAVRFEPGELVAICLPRSVEQIVAMLAVWRAGGACLPVDPHWPRERVEFMIADARCVGRIAHSFAAGAAIYEPLAIAGDAIGAAPAATRPASAAAGSGPVDLAYVIYTSGSTGLPKGVEISHGNLANLIQWHIASFAITPETRAAQLSSIGFDAGIWEVWPHLCAGASVSIVPDLVRGSAGALKQWLVDEAIHIAFAPTLLAEQLIAMEWAPTSALRVLLTGADTLVDRPPETLPFALVNNYGPTECTVVATSGRVTAATTGAARPSIGRPIANCQLQLLDEAQQPVATGQIGELYIGGAGVGLGYRNRPDLTAERFVRDPSNPTARLYRTGDLAAQNAQGDYDYHGRIDDQVKIRGHRVEPEEVAALLRQHAAISAATVVARRDGDGAMALIAYVVASEPLLQAETIRAHLAAFLPDYLIPASFVRLDQLPVTRNGKLDKQALPDPSPANQLAQTAYQEPTSPVEQRLAGILAEVLKRDEVGLDDNFFLIGGHSLLGTQIVIRASDAFGVDLALRDLFDAPTARQLARLLERRIIDMVDAMTDDQAMQLSAA